MFGLFKRQVVNPLSARTMSIVRSHTRALIKCANAAEQAKLRAPASHEAVGNTTTEWQAMASGEAQLACSIAAAVSGDVGIQAIMRDVIRPMLEEAVVVSNTAHDAILRAVGSAERP